MFVSFVGLGIAFAIDHYNEGYKIPENGYKIIKDLDKDVNNQSYGEDQNCIKVNNHNGGAGLAFFTPTKTKNEWDKFKTWCDGDSDCSIQRTIPEGAFNVVDTGGYTEDDDDGNGIVDYPGEQGDNKNNDICTNGSYSRCYVFSHTCGINSLGSVECWWDNHYGQTNVPSSLTNGGVRGIYTGFGFTFAIDHNGKLVSWGKGKSTSTVVHTDISSQFKDGSSPVRIFGLGVYSACAVDENNNKLYCWGPDWNSETQNIKSGFENGIKFVSVGAFHTCAVKKDGTMGCWGKDGDSYKDKGQFDIPTGWNTDIRLVTAGKFYTCTIKESGEMNCWGNPDHFTIPDLVSEGWNTGIKEVEAGIRDFCAIKTDGTIKCWGANEYGIEDYKVCKFSILANKNSDCTTYSSYETTKYKSIGINFYNICAIKKDNTVYCWGHENKDVSNNVIPAGKLLYGSVANFYRAEDFD